MEMWGNVNGRKFSKTVDGVAAVGLGCGGLLFVLALNLGILYLVVQVVKWAWNS